MLLYQILIYILLLQSSVLINLIINLQYNAQTYKIQIQSQANRVPTSASGSVSQQSDLAIKCKKLVNIVINAWEAKKTPQELDHTLTTMATY